MPPRSESDPVVREVFAKNKEDEYIGTATYTHVRAQAEKEHTWKLLEQVCIKFTIDSAQLAQRVSGSGQRATAFEELSRNVFGESLTYYISTAAGTSLRIPRKMFRVLDKKTKDGHGSFVEFGATFWFTHTQDKFDFSRDNFAVFLGKCTKLDYVCRFDKDGKLFAFVGDKEEQAASARSLNQAPEDTLEWADSSFSNKGTNLQTPENSVVVTTVASTNSVD
jgi:hypothetical protein